MKRPRNRPGWATSLSGAVLESGGVSISQVIPVTSLYIATKQYYILGVREGETKNEVLLMLGTTELIVVLAIVVLLFGAKKIPDLASGMGKGIRSFKKALNEPDAIDVTPTETTEGENATKATQEV